MRVVRAETLGFCPGVRRAVGIAMAAARRAAAEGRPAYVLGQIVHNPRVAAELEAAGARRLAEGEPVPPGAIVVVRSHGATLAELSRLEAAGAEIVDATCPKVVANQRAAAAHAAAGRTVVVAGDRGHGETASVASRAPGAMVADGAAAAAAVPPGPVALIAQTTISEAEYAAIKSALADGHPDLIDSGGVCGATRERQAAVAKLAKGVDAIVVVGGLNSANTRRLAELARSLGVPAWQVESAAAIPAELGAYGIVGLAAGASTPDEDIDEAEAALLALPRPPAVKARGA